MFVALAGAAFASSIPTVSVVYNGTHGPQVSDPNGIAVTPYEVAINGVIQVVTCYDVLDDVSRQDSWEAYEYSLDDAISQGMFSTGFSDPTTGYKSIGWLSAQTYSGQSEEIGLQYAIWSVFGDNAHFQYLLANLTTAEQDAYNDFKGDLHNEVVGNFANFDFSHTIFLEPTTGAAGASGTKQAMVFAVTPGGGNQTSTPEPGTMVMIGSGLLCLLSSIGFKKFARKQS